MNVKLQTRFWSVNIRQNFCEQKSDCWLSPGGCNLCDAIKIQL